MIRLIILLCLVFAPGCAFFSFTGLLRNAARNEKEIQAYVKREEARFLRLKREVQAGRLKKGWKKSAISGRYGEPVVCEPASARSASAGTIRCVYRHPTEFISTDLIYLYFSPEGKLVSWEFEPRI